MTDDCARSIDLNAPATQRDIRALWKAVHQLEDIGPPRGLDSTAPGAPPMLLDVAMRLQKEMVVARITEDHLRSKLTDMQRELEEAKEFRERAEKAEALVDDATRFLAARPQLWNDGLFPELPTNFIHRVGTERERVNKSGQQS